VKDWFESLEAREQVFIVGGGLVVMVALVWALVWLPLDKSQRELAASVANWEQSLTELRPLKTLAASQPTTGAAIAASSRQAPIIIVDETLRSRGLEQYRRRSQPTSNNGIRVEFENVAFDDLVLWLGDLSVQHSMHVQAASLSVASRAGPGRINASLTLERAF